MKKQFYSLLFSLCLVSPTLSGPAFAGELSSSGQVTLAQFDSGISGGISGRIGGDLNGRSPRATRVPDPARPNQPMRRAQSNLCVVAPERGSNSRRASVCSTAFSPVGSSCRCQNVRGIGTVRAAN